MDYNGHSVYACWQLLCAGVSVTIINYCENCIRHCMKAMHKQKHFNGITFACSVKLLLPLPSVQQITDQYSTYPIIQPPLYHILPYPTWLHDVLDTILCYMCIHSCI